MTVKIIKSAYRYLGLSTDTKPTEVPVGSVFKETDTLDVFICYDGTLWTKFKRNSDMDRTSKVGRTLKPNDEYAYGG